VRGLEEEYLLTERFEARLCSRFKKCRCNAQRDTHPAFAAASFRQPSPQRFGIGPAPQPQPNVTLAEFNSPGNRLNQHVANLRNNKRPQINEDTVAIHVESLNLPWPNLSGRWSACVGRSVTACQFRCVTSCFPQSPEDLSLQALLHLTCTAPSMYCPRSDTPHFGHSNRSFYLLTYLLTYLLFTYTYTRLMWLKWFYSSFITGVKDSHRMIKFGVEVDHVRCDKCWVSKIKRSKSLGHATL